MIPSTNGFLSTDYTITEQPSLTYALSGIADDSFGKYTVAGQVDELESVRQAIYKILSTERYKYVMYSWNYGIELLDLYGEPITYVIPEIQRRIIEALLMDDRVNDVDNFIFDTKGRVISMEFEVYTVFGKIALERAVNF